MRDADLLLRGVAADADAPGEPRSAVFGALACPALRQVEAADQDEEFVGRARDDSGMRRDLVAECVDLFTGERWRLSMRGRVSTVFQR
jgi:hypothetical protein